MTDEKVFSQQYIQLLHLEIMHYRQILSCLHKSCENAQFEKVQQYCNLEKNSIDKINSIASILKPVLSTEQWQNLFLSEMTVLQHEQESLMHTLVEQRDGIQKKLQDETKVIKKLRLSTPQQANFLDIQC